MSFILVKNKNNTTGKTLPTGYTSWLDFWEKSKRKKALVCERMLCKNTAEVGGHVIKSGEGNKEYILPLCKDCNHTSNIEEFKAWESDLIAVKN
ncbi:hypothetical protein [Limnobaculum parvum]|uniref:Uncharacterized protein n=1 Tax=Limnobaculum parvum TaxID=2172103 RepID=A0A2Y9TU31_9GAMM|nr:hypothetical protein [Limnobaculum parvum]AWH87074.1 hypothetical protein HYN51_00010 [Limnobaculum parvum]AWH89938.1 hypothetical protein HYN51_16175 [Limnobaculum parvum]